MDRRALWSVLRLVVLLFLVIGVTALAHATALGDYLEETARRLATFGERPWAPFAFAAAYAVALGLGMPGSVLTLVGGVTFGLWPGLAVNLAGAVAGAALAFYEARALGRDLVTRLAGRRLAHLEGLSSPRTSFFLFARLRLIPFVPFNGVNFAAGLTRAPLRAYLAGTAVGILPSTFLWTYFAAALTSGRVSLREAAAVRLMLALLALSLLSFVPHLVQAVRRRRGADR